MSTSPVSGCACAVSGPTVDDAGRAAGSNSKLSSMVRAIRSNLVLMGRRSGCDGRRRCSGLKEVVSLALIVSGAEQPGSAKQKGRCPGKLNRKERPLIIYTYRTGCTYPPTLAAVSTA